jgi:hypothetical protein
MNWNDIGKQLLVGHKIVKVEYMSKEEAGDFGWDNRPICILLDNGLWLYPSRDDEGNDAGALWTSDGRHPILPVLSTRIDE